MTRGLKIFVFNSILSVWGWMQIRDMKVCCLLSLFLSHFGVGCIARGLQLFMLSSFLTLWGRMHDGGSRDVFVELVSLLVGQDA